MHYRRWLALRRQAIKESENELQRMERIAATRVTAILHCCTNTYPWSRTWFASTMNLDLCVLDMVSGVPLCFWPICRKCDVRLYRSVCMPVGQCSRKRALRRTESYRKIIEQCGKIQIQEISLKRVGEPWPKTLRLRFFFSNSTESSRIWMLSSEATE